jgi:hypothetical protein
MFPQSPRLHQVRIGGDPITTATANALDASEIVDDASAPQCFCHDAAVLKHWQK